MKVLLKQFWLVFLPAIVSLLSIHSSSAMDDHNYFKKTGIPTMDQHGFWVRALETSKQKIIAQNSFISNTVMPWIRQRNVNNLIYYSWGQYCNASRHKDANSKIQKLGKKAQEKMNIAQEQQVPIKILNENFPIEEAYGFATSSGIFIRDTESHRSLNLVNFVLLHEAAHRKHWDSECILLENFFGIASTITFLPIALFNIYLWKKAPSHLTKVLSKRLTLTEAKIKEELNTTQKIVSPVLSFLAWIKSSLFCTDKFYEKRSAFKESRADYTALKAMDCHVCVNDLIRYTKDSTRGGYLNSDDISLMAKKLEKKKRICTYHAEKDEWDRNDKITDKRRL